MAKRDFGNVVRNFFNVGNTRTIPLFRKAGEMKYYRIFRSHEWTYFSKKQKCWKESYQILRKETAYLVAFSACGGMRTS